MSKRIVYTRPEDGGLCVVTPAPKDRRAEESEDAWLKRVIKQSVPRNATDVKICEYAALPQDRTWRDAWRFSGGAVAIDMPIARDLHRNKLRALRAPLLAALDIEYQRADEFGDPALKAEIATRKQTLRDLPANPAIDTAATPDELYAVWPQPRLTALERSEQPSPPEATPPPPAPVPPFLGHPGASQSMSAPKPSMQDILASAEKAVRQEQLRWELALMALNHNVDAMQAMQSEAVSLGLTVEQLARQIVDEREAARLSGETT